MSKMNHLAVNLPLVYLLTFLFVLAVTQRWTYAPCNHATYFYKLTDSFPEVAEISEFTRSDLYDWSFEKGLQGSTMVTQRPISWWLHDRNVILAWSYHHQPFLKKFFLEKNVELWKQWHWKNDTFIWWYIWLNKLIKLWLHIWPIF